MTGATVPVFGVRHHDGSVTRHLPNPEAAVAGASMAYAAAVDQDLRCAVCPPGWRHIAHGRIDTCRYCGREVVLGKHGWRLDAGGTGGEACESAPRGYHGVGDTPVTRPLADLIAQAEAAASPVGDTGADEGPYRFAGLSTLIEFGFGGVPVDAGSAGDGCRVYWGSHGCHEPRGHGPDVPHACDCCECETHPDPDSGCVARPPYYGDDTRFYGEDAETLGLPLVKDT